MVRKTIIWSERASSEFREILEFYTKRNGNASYSFKVLTKTNDLLEVLASSEFIGRPTKNKKTRVVVMDVYLIFYEIHKNRIEILSFWDNRRNPEKALADR
ncbi:MAG: type II toxin-antitoxin system RelE/ParE family toxin [Bacteroidales bacterium]|nr:type II toxin-antitoxin system RelE/ParE family toxin [Bacteroidales bacterium]